MPTLSLTTTMAKLSGGHDPTKRAQRMARKNELHHRKRALIHVLEFKIQHALREKYKSGLEVTKNAPEWDTIEELSSTLHTIRQEIDAIEENDRECWDEIECLIYDV
tara:strand:+ start:476 stop:796 length:321 start_codon:yes stop_codon:yes gene_type:complete